MKKPKKILIIRFSSIGDIVLTTPLLRCIKEQMPHSEVHFLTKKQFGPVLEANPYLDQLWLYDHNFKDMIPMIKSQGIEFIVDLHNNYRSNFVKKQFYEPNATFPKLNFRKWITVNLKINVLPDIHIVDRYFKSLQLLGVENDGNGLDYFIPEKDEIDINILPPEFHKGYIAFVIGGKHNTKILPAEKSALIGDQLTKPVILLGGEEDHERGQEIVRTCKNTILNACGKYNINQSASLVRQSEKVISNDTGLMHIAAAFKKPILSVWGNTIPAFGMTPYLPDKEKNLSTIFEVKGLYCRPCSKIGFDKCPRGHFRCMNDQNLEGIIANLNAPQKPV
jgi:ADP-heptose:LPS heptosyltransferase